MSLEVKQFYACDIDSATRDSLAAALPQGCTLFKDAFELPKGFATTHDDSQMSVPAAQWMIAGFPCTSMSSLNARAKHNRDCLRKRSAASGSVFGAIIDRMESQAGTLLAMTFENVPQIATGPPGASNLDTLIEVCSEVFCLDVVPWRLCPRDFGSPQSRMRAWMATCKKGRQHPLKSAMNRFTDRVQMNSLDEYLLTDDDPQLIVMARQACAERVFAVGDYQFAYLSSAGRVVQHPKAEKNEGKCKWPRQHAALAEVRGLCPEQETIISEQILLEYPGLGMLTERELGALRFAGVTDFPHCGQHVCEFGDVWGQSPVLRDRICVGSRASIKAEFDGEVQTHAPN